MRLSKKKIYLIAIAVLLVFTLFFRSCKGGGCCGTASINFSWGFPFTFFKIETSAGYFEMELDNNYFYIFWFFNFLFLLSVIVIIIKLTIDIFWNSIKHLSYALLFNLILFNCSFFYNIPPFGYILFYFIIYPVIFIAKYTPVPLLLRNLNDSNDASGVTKLYFILTTLIFWGIIKLFLFLAGKRKQKENSPVI